MRQSVPLHSVEKLTKHIRLGPNLLVSERLHSNLVRISQLCGNAPMRSALIMSALEGSESILQKLDKSTDTNSDKAAQAALFKLFCDYESAITACAKANGCDEVEAIEVLLSIGAKQGSVNGYQMPEEKVGAAKRRA